MGGQVVLDVVFGVVFVFFVFSLLCSGVNEAISRIFSKRSRFLEAGIWRLFEQQTSDTTSAETGDTTAPQAAAEGTEPAKTRTVAEERFQEFWSHPLVQQLYRPVHEGRILGGLNAGVRRIPAVLRTPARWLRDALHLGPVKALTGVPEQARVAGGDNRVPPSYIPTNTFALVVVDLLAKHPTADTSSKAALDSLVELAKLAPAPVTGQAAAFGTPTSAEGAAVTQALLARAAAAERKAAADRAEIERWFDTHMERVSGWYKRETKAALLAISVLVVLSFNINSIAIARTLWTEPTVRDLVARTAQHTLDVANASTTTSSTRGPAASSAAGPSSSTSTTPTAQHVPPIQCDVPTSSSTSTSTPPAPAPATTTVPPARSDLTDARNCARALAAEGLPIGWPQPAACQHLTGSATACHGPVDRLRDAVMSQVRAGAGSILLLLLGWGFSVGALSMGAPFWWDQLNRLGSLRGTGPKPKPSS